MLWWELNGLQLNKEQTMAFPVCFPLGLDKGLCYPQPAAKQFLYVLYSYFEVLCCPVGVGGKVLKVTASYHVCLSGQPAFPSVLSAGTSGLGRDEALKPVNDYG